MYHDNVLFKHFDIGTRLALLFYLGSNIPTNVFLPSCNYFVHCFVPHSLVFNSADLQWCLFESEQGNIEYVAQSGAICHIWVCFSYISAFTCLKIRINSFCFLNCDHFRYPNLKSVKELIYKRGFGKLNKRRTALTDNSIIEQVCSLKPILCSVEVYWFQLQVCP